MTVDNIPHPRRDFWRLTDKARRQVFDHIAQAVAHDRLGADATAVQRVAATNNTLYRVQGIDGTYALRVHRPDLKPAAWIDGELAWLHALRQRGEQQVPQPASPVIAVHLNEDPEPFYVSVLHWITGDALPMDHWTPAHAEAAGRLAARLHTLSDDIDSSDKIRPRLDAAGLFGQVSDSPYALAADAQHLLSAEQQAVLNAVQAQAQQAMAALDGQPGAFGFIHADLLPKNLLWRDGLPWAIDFDDCAYGYRLYDLAPVLLGFKLTPEADPALSAALWRGYTALRPQPEGQHGRLEALTAGRYAASIHWVAGNPDYRARAAAIIRERVAHLRGYLDTGTLALSAQPGG